jgi:hypothetical protein
MEGPDVLFEVSSAILVASDSREAVCLWKILSGRKVVGCPSFYPLPEIFHAVGMLPVLPNSEEEFRVLSPVMDEFVRFPDPFPKELEGTLNWVESVAELAEAVSGEVCTDGALERSVRFYRERDVLAGHIKARFVGMSDDFLDPVALRLILDSGRFLPVETHVMLLANILGRRPEDVLTEETGSRDTLLCLAQKIYAEMESRKLYGGC